MTLHSAVLSTIIGKPWASHFRDQSKNGGGEAAREAAAS